jgi:hypothetical protein
MTRRSMMDADRLGEADNLFAYGEAGQCESGESSYCQLSNQISVRYGAIPSGAEKKYRETEKKREFEESEFEH